MARKKKTESEKRIDAEVRRLDKIFEHIDDNSKELSESLIKRASFMRITLEKYEADLEADGYVELFSQSEKTPPYERERPVARLYTSLNKNYQSIMKQLFDILPKEEKKEQDDGFDDFVNGREDI